jgi:hypothetical protein
MFNTFPEELLEIFTYLDPSGTNYYYESNSYLTQETDERVPPISTGHEAEIPNNEPALAPRSLEDVTKICQREILSRIP